MDDRADHPATLIIALVVLLASCDTPPDTFLVVRATADADLQERAARAVVRAGQGAVLFDGEPRFPLVTLVTPSAPALRHVPQRGGPPARLRRHGV
jgi:hypothetical protein